MDDQYKASLVHLVERIISFRGPDDELAELVDEFERKVPYPGAADLIYSTENSPEEIVDLALSYQPVLL